MLEEPKKKSNMGIGIGIALAIVGAVLMNGGNESIGLIVSLVGGVAFIYGCFMFATAKGYSPALGLLGFLGIIGLIILVLMPDKAKDGAVTTPAPPAA